MTRDWKMIAQKEIAITKLAESKERSIPCPLCGAGKFRGMFYHSCDNEQCALHDRFAEAKCGICRVPRIHCCC